MSIATEQPLLSPVSPAPELPVQPAPVAPEARTSPKATWALVCGIAGMIVFALLFSTVAIALGVVAAIATAATQSRPGSPGSCVIGSSFRDSAARWSARARARIASPARGGATTCGRSGRA